MSALRIKNRSESDLLVFTHMIVIIYTSRHSLRITGIN